MRKPAANGGDTAAPASRALRSVERRAGEPSGRPARERRRAPLLQGLLRMPSFTPRIHVSDAPFTGQLLWVPFPGPWSERVLHLLLGRRRAERLRYRPPN